MCFVVLLFLFLCSSIRWYGKASGRQYTPSYMISSTWLTACKKHILSNTYPLGASFEKVALKEHEAERKKREEDIEQLGCCSLAAI